MLIPILEVCRKRKRSPKCFNFQTFGEPGFPTTFTGPFRDNIRLFVDSFAEPEDYDLDGMPIWCTLLDSHDDVVLPLYTVEESVDSSQNPICHLCRRTGWGSNYVSRRKYHIIIPSHGGWNSQLEEEALNLQTHLLHGLIHCNGYGHLLSVNGIEGGSKHLSGREIMSLWDRICGALQARSISVEDVAKKNSMDLRLLYGVAYGHSWFGKWGYRFNRGSFGVSEQNYHRAIEILTSLQLDPIVAELEDKNRGVEELKRIVRYYRDLSRTQLIKLGELLRFMLDLKTCRCGRKNDAVPPLPPPPPQSSSVSPPTRNKGKPVPIRCRKFSSVIATLDSRWSARRMEFAAEVIVEALKEGKNTTGEGMSRQQVRDAARMHVGDTGLLDYVLKSMNNVVLGSSIVRRAVNPRTRILEYSILDVGMPEEGQRARTPDNTPRIEKSEGRTAPGIDVENDVISVYTNLLIDSTDSELMYIATRTVLDSKQFVKEWPFNYECEQLLKLLVRVIPNSLDLDEILDRKVNISEVLVLPRHATMFELKRAVEEALIDTYCSLENVEVIEIRGMEDVEEDDHVMLHEIQSGSEIVVRVGTKNEMLRCGGGGQFEGGGENWRVKCECGAQDDDGERMVACDVCEVWQHTRCVGIDDSEKAPPLFVCSGCCVVLQEEGAGKVEMIEYDHDEEYMMLTDGGVEFGDYHLCV
ncbi:PHD finger protein MALE MEIOCYTE DEATH 1 [Linum grandiflorum]